MARYTIEQNTAGNIFFTDLDQLEGDFNLPLGCVPAKNEANNSLIFQDLRGAHYKEFDVGEIESITDRDGVTTVIGGDLDLLYNTLTSTFFFKGGFITGGSSNPNLLATYRADNYTDLITNVALSPSQGETAYVVNNEGTPWLPGRLGGSYRAKGLWYYDGVEWISDKEEIAEQLQINIDDIDDIENANAAQDILIAANTAKVSADGSINTHSDVDVQTSPPSVDDLLRWDGSNWVPSETDNGYTIFAIWAEENGGLSNNNRQWSYGNGATGAINIVLPIDCELFAASLDVESGGSSGVSINIFKNDAIERTTKSFQLFQDFETFATPTPFTAGDYVGVGTAVVGAGGATDARFCMFFRIRSSALSTSQLNDLLDVIAPNPSLGEVLFYDGNDWVPVVANPSLVGLGNVDNTSDADKPVSTAQQAALDLKYDASNPNGYETPTQLNARDTANRNRANHTGTQVAATISDFDAEVSNNPDVVANTAKVSYPPADAAKLAGIEAGAEVNQTDAEIKVQYENNVDTNAFTDAEKSKLAGLESSKFLGEFPSLAALQLAFPSPDPGSYANVDTGVGQDVERYIWDSDDNQYVLQLGESTQLTDAQIKTQYENNPDTNAFTDAEQTKLASITSVGSGQIITATERANIAANNAKVSADGSVTTHNDVSDAGSGQIITVAERNQIGANAAKISADRVGSFESNSTLDPNVVAPVQIPITGIRGKNTESFTLSAGAIVIPTDGFYKVSYKFLADTNSNNRLSVSGIIRLNGVDVGGTLSSNYAARNNPNPVGLIACTPVQFPAALTAGDTIELFAFRAGTQAGASQLIANETIIELQYLGT